MSEKSFDADSQKSLDPDHDSNVASEQSFDPDSAAPKSVGSEVSFDPDDAPAG